jgi:hypothetical protein
MSLTPTELGALLIALSITAYALGRLPKARAVAIFLGVVLLGLSGHLVSIAAKGITILQSLGGTATAWAFGAAVPGLLVAVGGFILIHDVMPKHSAKRRTFWLALALGVIVAAGASGIPALSNLAPATRTAVTQTTSAG